MVELERLRGITEAGFTRLDGRLDLVLQRTDRAEADVRQLRDDHSQAITALRQTHNQDITELRMAVDELRRRRWPLPSVAALTSLTALAITLYGLTAH